MMSRGVNTGSGGTPHLTGVTSSGLLQGVQVNDPEAWQRLLGR
jgi:hypothetical protein